MQRGALVCYLVRGGNLLDEKRHGYNVLLVIADGVMPAGVENWPNITDQKKALPGADDAAKEDNKIAALTLEGGS